jgi:hypothetical protein
LEHLFLFVTKQSDFEIFFGDEILVTLDAIGAHTQNCRPQIGKVGQRLGKLTRFGGTPGGIVFGVEIEHHPTAAQIPQAYLFAVLVGQAKFGGFLADFNHGEIPYTFLDSITKKAHNQPKGSPMTSSKNFTFYFLLFT